MTEEQEAAYNRLAGYLQIDMLRLDDELIELPVITQEISENAAFANHRRDRAEAEFDSVESELAHALRTGGEGKAPSEQAIKSMLPQMEEYNAARNTFLDAKLDAALWAGLVSSFQRKSYSLGTIGELISAGYLTPDSIRRTRQQEMHEARSAKQ